jgi:hypothetical protein
MQIDPALLTSAAGLVGALIGGAASLTVAMYTQRNQQRLQRVAHEIEKREGVYGEFMAKASDTIMDAYVSDVGAIDLTKNGQQLIRSINRMRLFAPPEVVHEAEATLKAIIEISLKPSVSLGDLAKAAMSKRPDPDRLLRFAELCRADLETLPRTVA